MALLVSRGGPGPGLDTVRTAKEKHIENILDGVYTIFGMPLLVSRWAHAQAAYFKKHIESIPDGVYTIFGMPLFVSRGAQVPGCILERKT